jgi:hypothetical protein
MKHFFYYLVFGSNLESLTECKTEAKPWLRHLNAAVTWQYCSLVIQLLPYAFQLRRWLSEKSCIFTLSDVSSVRDYK